MKKNQHKYSNSVSVLPSRKTQIDKHFSNNEQNNEQQFCLPLINAKRKQQKILHSSLPPFLLKQATNSRQLKNLDIMRQSELSIQIKQKAKLLKELKQKIIQYNDNVLVKKVLSQIRNTSYGLIIMESWKNLQVLQHCNAQLVNKIEKFYQVQLDRDFLKSMDYVNNVCRFILASYKKKQWKNTENETNKLQIRLKDNIQRMCKKMEYVESPSTKLQIITALSSLKHEYSSKNKRYMDWKQRALDKLKQNKIHCQLLSAEVFAEGFMDG